MDNAEDAGKMAALAGAQFPVLYDPEGQVVRMYGVYNLLGDKVATPSTFIVKPGGTISWSYVGAAITDRPPASETLQRLP